MLEAKFEEVVIENGLFGDEPQLAIDREAGEFDFDVYDERNQLMFSVYEGPETNGIVMFQTKVENINDKFSDVKVIEAIMDIVSKTLEKPVIAVFNHRLQEEYKGYFEKEKSWHKLDLRHKTMFAIYLPPCCEDYTWNSEAYSAYVNSESICKDAKKLSDEISYMLAGNEIRKINENGIIQLKSGKYMQLRRNLSEQVMCVLSEDKFFAQPKTFFINFGPNLMKAVLRKVSYH